MPSKLLKMALLTILLMAAGFGFGIICRRMGFAHQLFVAPFRELLRLMLWLLLSLILVAVVAGMVAVLFRPQWLAFVAFGLSGVALLFGWGLTLRNVALSSLYVLAGVVYTVLTKRDLRQRLSFSVRPVAEPTLSINLRELVAVVREVMSNHPVAVLTNASLIWREDVRADLRHFDIVVAKLDAPTEELFRRINRPVGGVSLAQILAGIGEFREAFDGKLALQMMFTEANRDQAGQMAALARTLHPDQVQLNTPLRPCPVQPLSFDEMARIQTAFVRLATINVYTAQRLDVAPLDVEATRRRRPREGRPAVDSLS